MLSGVNTAKLLFAGLAVDFLANRLQSLVIVCMKMVAVWRFNPRAWRVSVDLYFNHVIYVFGKVHCHAAEVAQFARCSGVILL